MHSNKYHVKRQKPQLIKVNMRMKNMIVVMYVNSRRTRKKW